MPTDPERRWVPEPTVEFQFPASLKGHVENVPRIPNPNDYRLAAERLLKVLHAIDEIMIHSRQPQRDWQQISLALDLPSCRYLRLTEAAIGRQFGITKMGVSRSISKLLRLAEIKPNGRGYNGQ